MRFWAALLSGVVVAAESAIVLVTAGKPADGVFTLHAAADHAIVRAVPLAGSRMTVSAEPGSVWEGTFASETHWSPAQTITFPPAGTTTELPIRWWRLGTVNGKVVPGETGVELPDTIALVVESPPVPSRPQEIARGTRFECPVKADGSWSCRVPATMVDLALRSTGMAPHYRWDVDVKADTPVELGVFALRKGGSLSAWLDRGSAQSLKEPARARLMRAVAPEASASSTKLRVPVAEGTFNARGMVLLAPVPAGTYILEVHAPGFAVSRVGPLEIYEGRETVARKTIELKHPLAVEVTVTPPADPAGIPWRIQWAPQNTLFVAGETAVERSVDDKGSVTIAGQVPGVFLVSVRDGAGNTMHDEAVTVAEGAQASVAIRLNLHHVRGVLTLGDHPIAASLWFGTHNGAERVRMVANEDGKFEGDLARTGRWTVEVVSDDGIHSVVQADVVDEADLAIRLADTSVSGWVVGSDGKRVTRGSINVKTGSTAFTSELDPADGTFTFRSLPAGPVSLMARDRRTGETSRGARVELVEERPVRDVELRIEPLNDLAGRVTSRGQTVVGARVSAVALGMGGQTVRTAVTGIDGRFSVRVAQGAERVLLTVAAPGRTLHSFEVAVAAEPVVLDVAPVGGALEIVAPGQFRLSRDGVEVGLNDLFDWMAAHGDPLTDAVLRAPDLAPGQYRLCSATPPVTCQSGGLVPGGSLQLVLRQDASAP